MKRFILTTAPALLLIVLAFALAGCGTSSPTTNSAVPNEVDMTYHDFSKQSVSVKAGTAVHFVNPGSGSSMHILCLGQNGRCSDTSNGPQDLRGSGFTLNEGQTKDVIFTTAGTYQVTCSIHPDMNVTITVS